MTIHEHTAKVVFDAFAKEYPNREIKVAGGEDSIQVVVFPGLDPWECLGAKAYIHVIDSSDPEMAEFVCINDGHIIEIPVEAMMPPEDFDTQGIECDKVSRGDGPDDATVYASQEDQSDEPSDAWQLLEVANEDLAERLIEHYKLGSELIHIDADTLLDMIARMIVTGGDA